MPHSTRAGKGIMPYIREAFAGQATVTPPILYDAKQNVPKGRERWVQSFDYPVKDEAGAIREVVLIHQDITALKQAEELARGQAAALARMLNALTAEPELDKFLGQVLAAIAEPFDAGRGALFFHDASGDTLSMHMTYDNGQIMTWVSSPGLLLCHL